MKINDLQKEKQVLLEQTRELKEVQADAVRAIHKNTARIKEIDETFKRLEEPIIVTDHALVRYMERVKGVDTDAIRKEMLPAKTEELIRLLGNATYPIDGTNAKAVVKNNAIITIKV